MQAISRFKRVQAVSLLVARPRLASSCPKTARPLRANLIKRLLSARRRVEGGTRDFVMYCGARCYSQRRRADTSYDVLDYVKSLKRFKAKPSLNVSVEDYLRYCHTNMSVYVKVD